MHFIASYSLLAHSSFTPVDEQLTLLYLLICTHRMFCALLSLSVLFRIAFDGNSGNMDACFSLSCGRSLFFNLKLVVSRSLLREFPIMIDIVYDAFPN